MEIMDISSFTNSSFIHLPTNVTSFEINGLVVILARLMWWYAVIMAIVGIILNIYGALYLILRAFKSSSFPCLICIVISDFSCLSVVFVSLTMAQIFPSFSGQALCKTMTFITNTSSLFSNWCWVILWGCRYIAVFHPWIHFRYKYLKISLVLPALLTICLILESWTLIFSTEVDRSCDLDESLTTYRSFKYVFLAESLLQFFVPFFLIVAADISVFSRTYYIRRPVMEQIESVELQSSARSTTVDTVMIVSQEYKQNTQACKQRMIKRFVILASIDLLLNMPHVILNLIEAFQRGSDFYILSYPGNYVAVTVSFTFFYLQYVFNVIHIHVLVTDYSRRRVSLKKRLLSNFSVLKLSKRK